ncbi:MAG: hypothetical protein H0T71_12675, partial [Acidobacteria bacterium]|nr:hypothetical protein [Acidobacteriota bacterium]
LHLHPVSSEATADDAQEVTERFGGRATLGMVSAFATDHDGELLLLNYGGGTVVRAVPDHAVVPLAPSLSGTSMPQTPPPGSGEPAAAVALVWLSRAEGIAAVSYAVERVRDGAVIERQVVAGPTLTLSSSSGDCFRVRGRSSDGLSGPPSNTLCPSHE